MRNLLQDQNDQQDTEKQEDKKEQHCVNIFQGRPEIMSETASYPDWDILPPNQFINPRIKTGR